MSDPLGSIGWPALLVAMVVLGAAACAINTRFPDSLRTDAAPRGIISFELPWSAGKAQRIIDAWMRVGKLDDVRTSIGVDWLFIPLYAATLGLLGVLTTRVAGSADVLTSEQAQTAAAVLLIAAGAAAILDATENVGMLVMLREQFLGQVVPVLTSLVSLVKWASIAILVVTSPAMVVVACWRWLV